MIVERIVDVEWLNATTLRHPLTQAVCEALLA
jgi:hypothetical protein